MKKYIIECRDTEGNLDFEGEVKLKKEHPYLFSKREFTIDNLCHYASYGQNRNNPSGPQELPAFMQGIGASYRVKSW